MHPSLRLSLAAAFAIGVCVAGPDSASGFAHLWEIDELYSDASGSVQYIELFTHEADERALSAVFLRSAGSGLEYHFPTNLSGSTLNHHLLVATAAFGSQPGAVTPDYVMPDDFIRMAGDTISFWTEPIGLPGYSTPILWDSMATGDLALPSNGLDSLNRDLATGEIGSARSSPTNFAGQTGALLPEPASAWLLAAGLGAIGLRRKHRVGRARRYPAVGAGIEPAGEEPNASGGLDGVFRHRTRALRRGGAAGTGCGAGGHPRARRRGVGAGPAAPVRR